MLKIKELQFPPVSVYFFYSICAMIHIMAIAYDLFGFS